MKLNTYLQGMIKIDATLCEHLIDFRKFTEQEFGGSFPSFVTFMDHSPASSRFFANQARAMLCFALFCFVFIIFEPDDRDIRDGPLMSGGRARAGQASRPRECHGALCKSSPHSLLHLTIPVHLPIPT
jgi:hypothetical protein